MFQVLYEVTRPTDSHKDRADALAAIVPGGRSDNISIAPVTRHGLTTLAFWGHGTQRDMCGKMPGQLKEVIKGWKRLNPGLKTVEIITCNSRHGIPDKNSAGNSFITQLKGIIGWRSSLKGLEFKALPIRMSGYANAHSILLAHAPNQSWCYITAEAEGASKSDNALIRASNAVKAEAKNCAYDLAQAANNVARQDKTAIAPRRFSLNYGYFNSLRGNLVVV